MKVVNKIKGSGLLLTIVLSVVFGFMAGVVGQLVSDTYFYPLDSADLEIDDSNRRVLRTLSDRSTVDVALANIITQTELRMAGVNIRAGVEAGGLLGTAATLTSDGWFLTHSDVLGRRSAAGLVITLQDKVLLVEEIVIDNVSGATLLKVDASELAVISLANSANIRRGQTLLVFGADGQIVDTSVVNLLTSGNATSESYRRSFELRDTLSDSSIGGLLLDLGGNLVGLVSGTDIPTAVPVSHFRIAIEGILRTGEVQRPELGLSFGVTPGNESAIVLQAPRRGTPAAQAELEEDDIILEVNGNVLDKYQDLAEVIQSFRPGDAVSLRVNRGGEEIIIEAFLGLLE
ncbi:hypothetical protein CL622_07095 [archaeon]|nr:hypothetical protein [archaeon]